MSLLNRNVASSRALSRAALRRAGAAALAVLVLPSACQQENPWESGDEPIAEVSQRLGETPATCQELKDASPGLPDGEYQLFRDGDPYKPWSVYCHDMAGTPTEYLSLPNTGGSSNFSQYTAGGAVSGTNVRTSYTKLRIDPATLIVDASDQTFTTSTGQLSHGSTVVTSMPYGVATSCDSSPSGVANIELRGTPFLASPDAFVVQGWAAQGTAAYSNGNQVVDLTGGGSCGWIALKPGSPAPVNQASGLTLQLTYVAPPVPGNGTELLDQIHDVPSPLSEIVFGPSEPFAQIFTAGRSGRLSRVSINAMACNNNCGFTLRLRLVNEAGLPDAIVGEGRREGPIMPWIGYEGAVWVDVSLASPPAIWAGRQYAIELVPDSWMGLMLDSGHPGHSLMWFSSSVCWQGATGWQDPFCRNSESKPPSLGWDMLFKTWVSSTLTTHPSDYVGCFQDGIQRQLPHFFGAGYTTASCKQVVRNAGLRYAGLQHGGECWGGGDPGARAANDIECNMPCPGPQDGFMCGGPLRNSVYDTWEYQGCFQDGIPRAMNYLGNNYSIESCRTLAAKLGYRYAGLQWYDECYAGNDIGFQQVDEAECNTPCSHNPGRMCGGNLRASVYGTGSAYVGCFPELSTSVLVGVIGTPETCIGMARALGYPYAALHGGGLCYASHYLQDLRAADSACDLPCVLDMSTKCGGEHYQSVYSTELRSTPARLYLQDTDRAGAGDWDPTFHKATCGNKEAVTGVSQSPIDSFTADVLCSYLPTASAAFMDTLAYPGEQRRAMREPDWDYGYYKLECGENEYVSGMSEGGWPYFAHAIRCSRSDRSHTTGCETRVVGGGNDQGFTGIGDWSYGNYKAECSPGKIVVGVSVSTGWPEPHKILCCNK